MDPSSRHEARRRAGVPTITVQVGAPGVDADPDAVHPDRALAWLDQVATLFAAAPGSAAQLAEQLPDLARLPLPSGPGSWARKLRAAFHEAKTQSRDPWRLLAAVARVAGPASCPPFAQRARSVAELAAALRLATRLAEECPALAAEVRVPDPAVWDKFARTAPDSREKALAREGLIVHAPGTDSVRFTATRAFLDSLPGGPALREQLVATVADAASAEAAGEPDRARSAAERFLFDVLESLPDTRGLFRLNAPLPFRFGPKVAEADLLAADLRLVVEVDGYRHFTDAEGYRRDRRKDLLLQSQGYFVLRVLADDVCTRLDTIVGDVREAAALLHYRRRPDQRTARADAHR